MLTPDSEAIFMEPQVIRQEEVAGGSNASTQGIDLNEEQSHQLQTENDHAPAANTRATANHNESSATGMNSSMEHDMNSTNGDLNNDSLAGNGADDEAEATAGEGGGDTAGPCLVAARRRTPRELALVNRSIDTMELSQEAGFEIKPDGKSNKYPLLKVYYEFGPWVGRNRKAICVRCKHTSASSQPERLIRHLRRCVALSDEDRQVAEELLLVSTLNKKGRKKSKRVVKKGRKNDNDETDDYNNDDDDDDDLSALIDNKNTSIIALPAGVKRPRRDSADRKAHVDQCLVRFIICNKIPIKSVHSKEFLDFVRALDPEYRLPTRENITNNLIPGLLNI